jgi:glycosyltransferase involved in cell wall biosynthesis
MSAPIIGFIGQGYVGKNMADDCERRGRTVVRYALEEPYRTNKDKIKDCDIVFIAVPTPSTPDGFDLSIVRDALGNVGKGKIAVIKSTVTPGTTAALQRDFPGLVVLCSPEFLSEATATYDAAHPHINIIGMGAQSAAHRDAAALVHSVLPDAPEAITCTGAEAEIIKYVRNGNGFTQVVFMNMMYDLAASLDADWAVVYRAIAADPFIPTRYAQPIHKSGRGAGGNCFIKDYAALRESYEHRVPHDAETIALMRANEAKNIALLRGSGKDLDLLAGVYGDSVIGQVPAAAAPALAPLTLDVKLLICAQSADAADPVLGFFRAWLDEFARRARAVSLIYLQGAPTGLAQNVRAFSLGKEGMRGLHAVKRVRYAARFLGRAWRERNAYDTVLVHINTEYVILAGLMWRLLGKRVALLANNTETTWKVRLASRFADVVFYTDPRASVARLAQAQQIPTGVETDVYAQAPRTGALGSLLFLGRLAPEKKLDIAIAAVERAAQHHACRLDVVGATILPGDEAYAADLRARFRQAQERGLVSFLGAMPHGKTPQAYASHDIFVHVGSVSGFNKTLFEAAASGCIVVTAAPELRHVVHEGLFIERADEESVAHAITQALMLTEEEKRRERAMLRSYVEREHSLSAIVPRVLEAVYPPAENARGVV